LKLQHDAVCGNKKNIQGIHANVHRRKLGDYPVDIGTNGCEASGNFKSGVITNWVT
jgi:hypothetical protein